MEYDLNNSSKRAHTFQFYCLTASKHKISCFLIIALVLFHFQTIAQVDNNLPLKDSLNNEFIISMNWSKPTESFTTDNLGFGLGAHHLFLSHHTLNLIVGIEYNFTSQFNMYIYEGPNTRTVNRTYYFNSLSFPLGLRVNIGKKNTFFIETGFFGDVLITSRQKGTKKSQYYDEDNNLITQTAEYNRDANLSSYVGIYLAMGFKISTSKFDLIIKPEARAGINELNQVGVHSSYIRLAFGIRI